MITKKHLITIIQFSLIMTLTACGEEDDENKDEIDVDFSTELLNLFQLRKDQADEISTRKYDYILDLLANKGIPPETPRN
ncbi:MAG: hypothetical protein ACOH5I_23415 [Oligoflexus sp.]